MSAAAAVSMEPMVTYAAAPTTMPAVSYASAPVVSYAAPQQVVYQDAPVSYSTSVPMTYAASTTAPVTYAAPTTYNISAERFAQIAAGVPLTQEEINSMLSGSAAPEPALGSATLPASVASFVATPGFSSAALASAGAAAVEPVTSAVTSAATAAPQAVLSAVASKKKSSKKKKSLKSKKNKGGCC
eukprot:CAMPEP_0198500152 /NCGR_PEP_ID=MMETSP1462-20131121/8020_1 /TAXON_ID=1333877 /ORGANISM="Brandtodinium nutriculum, Strain RCC3387" /LENGTH=185 /DNA_ID=CAMNT_0044229159 /DNA_START=54 /DNA_END=611 /DNA_ORIENTATION=+